MKLTANFDSGEFDIHTPWPLTHADNRARLASMLQWLRDLAGTPGRITSAYRPPERNAAVGGTETSQHMRAEAVDIVFPLTPLRILAARVLGSIREGTAPRFGQLIFYRDKGHIHVSLPTLGARNGEVRYSFEDNGARLYPMLSDATQLPMVSGAQTRGSLRRPAPGGSGGVADAEKRVKPE